MLTEPQLAELESKHGKIAIVSYSGHDIVFRRPSRDIAKDYRRKRESADLRADSMEQFAQAVIVAFNDINDPTAARIMFTGTFLEKYPLAISHPKFITALSALSGLVENEDAADLGKGVIVRPASPRTTQEGSPSGSAASSTTAT